MGQGQAKAEQVLPDNLKDVVNLVLSGDFDLDALKMPTYSTDEITKVLDDEFKPLKGVATDFVVNEFFHEDETLYRFMTQVYTTFERALAIYGQKTGIPPQKLLFLYKGGNILRIISREFLIELPASASRNINDFYSAFFKRSDADFSIYLDPSVKD